MGYKKNIDKLSEPLTLYELLIYRPFRKCSKKEKDLYNAWCLRIQETWEIWNEEFKKE